MFSSSFLQNDSHPIGLHALFKVSKKTKQNKTKTKQWHRPHCPLVIGKKCLKDYSKYFTFFRAC